MIQSFIVVFLNTKYVYKYMLFLQIQKVLNFYQKKLSTILTFVFIWICLLMIFTNSNTLDMLNDITEKYPVDSLNSKITEIESYQKKRLIISSLIFTAKIGAILYKIIF